MKKAKGITLIALVVTIVILLILAGITINLLFSNGGIFKVAQDAANAWNEAIINEQESLNNLADQIENLVNGQTSGGTPEEKSTLEQLIDAGTIVGDRTEVEDKYENPIVIPKGFKVTNDGKTIPEGVVIEDANENQFVWIPVGTVHKDSNLENDITIKLGRYTFDRNTGNDVPDGTPVLQQAAFAGDNPDNPTQTYADEVPIRGYAENDNHIELDEPRPGTPSTGRDGLNATAKNLAEFIKSVQVNGGYYIARYEASYGSGYNSAGSTDAEKYANAKPLSKVSTANSTSSMTYDTSGQLWNFITQLNASKVSQNMYANDNSVGVESDLINSYAWDTAIVFIQEMGNSNYANETDGNGTLKDTGKTEDEKCNIFDMAANIREWNTENAGDGASPCTIMGGLYGSSYSYTAYRNYGSTIYSINNIGFRVLLYIQ